MAATRLNNRNTAIQNGLNDDEVGSSETGIEMSKMTDALQYELNMSENSFSESEEGESGKKVE
ncbi:unnamed protein product, partial [Rotaria sp. Silwood1]